jgi:simple sugar transport system ATP-binding protein
VTHRLGEVAEVADRVTVLREGKLVGEADAGAIDTQTLVRWITGKPAAPSRARRAATPGEVLLAARSLRSGSGTVASAELDLVVRAGEIVGIGGVLGNGQTELIEALTGSVALRGGEADILGRRTKAPGTVELPRDVAWIPEDRREEGLALEMTLEENLRIGVPRDRAPRGEAARRRLEEFAVRPADPAALAAQLSGGNQQRLLLARELARGARLILAVHPTRGLDPEAAEDVRRRLVEARDAGIGVLLVTGDVDELRDLSDRILIFFRGRVVYEAARDGVDLETMHRALVGVTA